MGIEVAETSGARIGILGGSFNPAHEGHRHISLEALKRLGLDEIWWMVSPQNPLKPVKGMAPFRQRLDQARRVARNHPKIRVTGIETRLGTRYTSDTICALTRYFPNARFVWIMGADNLIQIPRWEEWTRIFESVPIAVFNRPTYSLKALNGQAAQRFRRYRLDPREARNLAERAPPAWVFLVGPLHPASATSIRAKRDGKTAGKSRRKPGKKPGSARKLPKTKAAAKGAAKAAAKGAAKATAKEAAKGKRPGATAKLARGKAAKAVRGKAAKPVRGKTSKRTGKTKRQGKNRKSSNTNVKKKRNIERIRKTKRKSPAKRKSMAKRKRTR